MKMIDKNSTKEEVLEAVKSNGFALQHASDALKADRELVLEVVRKHGRALKWASNKLKNDPEVVLEAVKQDRIRYSRYSDYSEEAQLNMAAMYVDNFSNKLKFELLECWVKCIEEKNER